jgi:hypothetical protein
MRKNKPGNILLGARSDGEGGKGEVREAREARRSEGSKEGEQDTYL